MTGGLIKYTRILLNNKDKKAVNLRTGCYLWQPVARHPQFCNRVWKQPSTHLYKYYIGIHVYIF